MHRRLTPFANPQTFRKPLHKREGEPHPGIRVVRDYGGALRQGARRPRRSPRISKEVIRDRNEQALGWYRLIIFCIW